ncbi:hypothetical protein ACFLZ7_03665 [Nanoarchaeota archaeon]
MGKSEELEDLKKEVERERKALYLEKYGFLGDVSESFADEQVIQFLKKKKD